MSELVTRENGAVLPASSDFELKKLLAQEVSTQGYDVSSSIIDMYKAKGATFSFQGEDFPGAKTLVYVLDFIYETTIHNGVYDPKKTEYEAPKAFAIGRDKAKLVWHENSHPDYVGKLCINTPECQRQAKGTPKLAKECVRVALLQAGEFDRNGINPLVYTGVEKDKISQGKIGFFRLSPTAVWDFEKYVASLQNKGVPLWAAQTLLSWSQDKNSSYSNCRAYFSQHGILEASLLQAVKERHLEVSTAAVEGTRPMIEYVYEKPEELPDVVEGVTKSKKY